MIKNNELKEELNKILVRLSGVKGIETLGGVKGNNDESVKLYTYDSGELYEEKIRLVILKSIIEDICFDKNDTFNKLDQYFLSW